ncbi:recQ [Mytilus coruscus]|uniref:DNA 3'-5' helicase n=1 Tax=Mytilus coruscus TaxID=42192 RepID=A0A6J8AJL1_MYTCO|nr:recQ [Mytilus coruscus]
MNVNNAPQVIETKYSFEFKEKQIEAINSIANGKDTFIVLPTGYGKTKIYSHLPEIYGLLNNMMGTILVISPLQSLMLDQVAKMSAIGIDATIVGECQPDKSVADHILKGDFGIVFSSPEAALTPGMWRKCFTSGVFCDNLKAVVIDEAHCITEWYQQPPKSIRTQILKKLDMIEKEVTTVYQLPDRQNIMYTVKKSRNNFIELQWLLDDIVKNKFNAKKTVVYCRNIATCANLYEHFSMNINQCDNITERLVAMYHRSTAKLNKDHVLEEFPKNNSKLRLVFATVAFGMGVDIPDIDYVVNWGAHVALNSLPRMCGRAGRDGRQSKSIVFLQGMILPKTDPVLK